MRDIHRAAVAGAVIVLLAGCSLLTGRVAAALDGEWQLQAGSNGGQPIPIPAGARITLKIDGTQVGGSAACNIYGGTLQVNGATIRISALSMTEMACRDDVMASEAAYLAALPGIATAARTGNSLVLNGPDVELSFVLVPPVADADLQVTVWVLDSLISGDAISSTVGEEATLQLGADGTTSGSTGCRTFSGHYTIAGNQVEVTLLPYDTFGCADGLAGQDEHVLAVIGNGFAATIEGDRLTLTAAGKGLGYRVAS